MNKIPSAKELLNTIYNDDYRSSYKTFYSDQCIEKAMIEFAKMHVQEALKQALESIPCLGSSTDIASYEEVEEAILNAYPLENIK